SNVKRKRHLTYWWSYFDYDGHIELRREALMENRVHIAQVHVPRSQTTNRKKSNAIQAIHCALSAIFSHHV
ncbi:hypothetical protein GOP47_0010793, partial [Adiantum capillus-veneris]